MTTSRCSVFMVLAFVLLSFTTRTGAAAEASKAVPKAQAVDETPSRPIPKALAVTPEEVTRATEAGMVPSPQGHDGSPAKPDKKPAAVSTMAAEELDGFETYPPALQQVVRKALELTTQNLRYEFGGSNPKDGGMDCSGTVLHVLQSSGIKGVPRQSDEICRWVMRHSVLYRTEDAASLKNIAYSALCPGSLLFWTGTYDTGGRREIPISHVMLYLGRRKKDGKPIVFGASDGRRFDGERRNGVSVFDFSLPQRGEKAAFYGYGPIPGMPCSEVRRAIPRAIPVYAAQ